MAQSPYNFFSVFNPDAADQQIEQQRRQKLIDELTKQSQEKIDPNRSSGMYVTPVSPLEGLGKAGQSIAAALMQKNLDKDQAVTRRQQMDALAQMFGGGASQPTNERTVEEVPSPPLPDNLNPEGKQGQTVTGQPSYQQYADALRSPQQQRPQSQGMNLSMPGMSSRQSMLMYMLAPDKYMEQTFKNQDTNTDLARLQRALAAAPPDSPQRAEIQAKINRETSGPILNMRGGSTAFDPATRQPMFSAPNVGQNAYAQFGPNGQPTGITPLPNAAAGMIDIQASNQRKLQLTQPEYLQYSQSGGSVLPTRYQNLADEFPGARFQDVAGGSQGALPQSQPQPQLPQQEPWMQGRSPQELAAIQAVRDADRRGQQASITVPREQLGQPQQAQQPPQGEYRPTPIAGQNPVPQRAVLGATQSGPEQVQQAGDTAQATHFGTAIGTGHAKIVSDAAQSVQQLRGLDQMASIIDDATKNYNPGKLNTIKQTIGQWLMGSGVPAQWVSQNIAPVQDLEALTGKVNMMVAQMVRQTDAQPAVKQMEMMREAYPNFAQTPGGMKATLDILRDAHIYNIEKLKAQQEYASRGGRMEGFENYWAQKAATLPLFGRMRTNDINQVIANPASGQPPQAPQTAPRQAPGQAGARGPRAVNPQTGQVIEWDGRQWVQSR